VACRKALAATAPAAQADLWLVWSNEHGAWWGPNESGYYTDIRSAGRYTKEKAMECADSRSHTKGKLPPEVIISERDAMEGKNPNAAQAGKETKDETLANDAAMSAPAGKGAHE
jgi:hypothetical protein